MNRLSVLYYPFSRCLDVEQLKQLIMLFDGVTFLDAIDDEEWRERLFVDIEDEDPRFSSYRDIAAAIPMLRQSGIVDVRSPETVHAIEGDLTLAATLSDLGDAAWVRSADPSRWGLATQRWGVDSRPAWNIFAPKIPSRVSELMVDGGPLEQHLYRCGGDDYAWSLSYAAGSSIGLNTHLAAAAELGLAPVTDSRLHHELLFMKLMRSRKDAENIGVFDAEGDIEKLTHASMVKLLSEFLPRHQLEAVSIEQILQFRTETAEVRRELFSELVGQFRAKIDLEKPASIAKAEAEVRDAIRKSLTAYRAEIGAVRNKLMPKLIDVTNFAVPAASMVGLATGYLGSAGYALAASVAGSALQITKQYLDWRGEYRKVQDNRSSAVAFLSRCESL